MVMSSLTLGIGAPLLQEIQSLLINWKGPDLTIYGELVLEGTFRVHRVRNEKTFFLFDKALLITKKRGDHFVYKGHIPCSSLMLIESTRDSLCFTVTHYKHSKQQYSIQVRDGLGCSGWGQTCCLLCSLGCIEP